MGSHFLENVTDFSDEVPEVLFMIDLTLSDLRVSFTSPESSGGVISTVGIVSAEALSSVAFFTLTGTSLADGVLESFSMETIDFSPSSFDSTNFLSLEAFSVEDVSFDALPFVVA